MAGPIETYIRQSAIARGIDPNVAVRVARAEGGLKNPTQQSYVIENGRRETSYGPFQLRIGGGVGDRALKAGIDPRQESDWQKGVDFALNYVAKHGWGEWHGARAVGLSNFAGITKDSQPAAITGAAAPIVAAPIVAAPVAAASPTDQSLPEGMVGDTGITAENLPKAIGTPIAPGYVVPAEAAAAFNAPPEASVVAQASADQPLSRGTLTQSDINAVPMAGDNVERDRVVQERYANIPWTALDPVAQQAITQQFGANAPHVYEAMRATLVQAPPTFTDPGAGLSAGGYGEYAPPADFSVASGSNALSGGEIRPFSIGPSAEVSGAGDIHPLSMPGFIGAGSQLHPDVAAMFFAPSGAPSIQAHATAPASYTPPASVPIQPYSTQAPPVYSGAPAAAAASAAPSPAMGAAAASGLQGYAPEQMPIAPSDAPTPMQMAMQGIPGEMSQMPVVQPPAVATAPAHAGLLGGLIEGVKSLVHSAVPNGVSMPAEWTNLGLMSGLKGFGGGPMPSSVTDKASGLSWLGSQAWHPASFNAISGGPSYNYFSPATPGGIGGYVSHDGQLYTYPTDSDIYHSVAS